MRWRAGRSYWDQVRSEQEKRDAAWDLQDRIRDNSRDADRLLREARNNSQQVAHERTPAEWRAAASMLRGIAEQTASSLADEVLEDLDWSFPEDDLAKAADRPRGLPIGNLTSQLWGNFYQDGLDHWITKIQRHGAYIRYTDDFLIFSNVKEDLWRLREGIVRHLEMLRLRLATPKSRLLATREGVSFCGIRFRPGVRPRILGVTRRRFERRRNLLRRRFDFRRLGGLVFAWYQYSREANSIGLRRSYAQPKRGTVASLGP